MTNRLSCRMKCEAVKLGLCSQWTEEWADGTSKDEMVDKFVRGLDFCIEHNWPSTDVMKRDFGDVIHSHGVYVDENVETHNAPMVILNGECVGDIEYTGTSAGEVYVRHKSEAKVKVAGMARCFISLYDEGEVSVECEEGCAAFVYVHGGKVKKVSGKVVVREREKTERNEEE